MFSFILSIDENTIHQVFGGALETDSAFTIEDCIFEITFLQKSLKHIDGLLENIDDNPLTHIIKQQILKIACILVQSTDSKLDGVIDYLSMGITGKSLKEFEEMIFAEQLDVNRYTMDVPSPCLPNKILTQIGGIPSSCGLHAVMHMLLSMGFTSNFFEFGEVAYQRAFAQGFNRLNNGEICTVMSEINDVLRSFADTLAAFIPPSRLYSSIGTKGLNDYNFSDLLKPSIKANFGIDKGINAYMSDTGRDSKMNIKESIIYDILKLSPEWLLFDIGMWCCFMDGINIELHVYDHTYRLHSFIYNTGFHYVCCVLDVFNTERGPVNVVHVYDDMNAESVGIEPLSAFSLDSIGAIVFHKV